MTPASAGWVRHLVALHERIAVTRMAGLPILHPALSVQAVAFAERDGGLSGILVTPWFMNLVWRAMKAHDLPLPVGRSHERQWGQTALQALGAWDVELGAYEVCALFSPMFEFRDQEAAVTMAQAVARQLWGDLDAPDRRRFLRGAWATGVST